MGRSMNFVEPHADRDLIDAIATSPSALVAHLNAAILSLQGVIAVTLLAHDPNEPFTRRIATSDPEIFPHGATEDMQDSAWHRRIFGEKIAVKANTPDEMTPFYPEAADLKALGFGAIISAPIVLSGQVRGVINILGEDGMLTPALLIELEHLIPIAALVLALSDTSGR